MDSLIEIPKEKINEAREWYPQWIVELTHGDPETGSGIAVERELVSKKWERVESKLERYSKKIEHLPFDERLKWFVVVTEIAGVKRGFFNLN